MAHAQTLTVGRGFEVLKMLKVNFFNLWLDFLTILHIHSKRK